MSFQNFAVIKYSYATNNSLNEAIAWTHRSPNPGGLDMQMVFHAATRLWSAQYKSVVVMKVMQGADLLETVQLQDLCHAGEQDVINARARNIDVTLDQLPIAAIVRCPVIALRFRSEGGKIRRVQVKLRRDEDFAAALQMLETLRCPITHSPSRDANTHNPAQSRPWTESQTTPQDRLRPHSSSSTIIPQQHQHSPIEGSPSVPAVSQPFLSNPIGHRAARGSLQRAFTSQDRQIYNDSLYHHPTSARPVSSSSRLHPDVTPHHLTGHVSGLTQARWTGPTPSPGFHGPSTLQQFEQRTTLDTAGFAKPFARPSTAPLSQLPDTITPLLPPKRILPFGQRFSPSRHSSVEEDLLSSRPTSSALDLPSLPAPMLASKSSGGAEGPHENRRPVLSDHNRVDPGQSYEVHEPLGTLDSNAANNLSLSSMSHLSAKAGMTSAKKPLDLADQHVLSSEQIRPSSSVSAANVALSRSDLISMSTHLGHGTTNDPTLHRSSTTLIDGAIKNMHAYASQSDAARQAELDTLICSYINDDGFLKLCQDVENSWRRIGLEWGV